MIIIIIILKGGVIPWVEPSEYPQREDQKIKWKEVEARLMGNENLRWRRGLVVDIVTKAESNKLLSQSQRVKNLGSGSRVFMQAKYCNSGH